MPATRPRPVVGRPSRRLTLATAVLAVGAWAALTAQSPNAFGQPSAATPQPAADIKAVPGSRAQGWLARDAPRCSPATASSRRAIRWRRRPGSRSCGRAATPSTPPSPPAPCSTSPRRTTPASAAICSRSSGSAKDKKLYALNSAGWAPAGWTPEFFTETLGEKRVPGNGVNAATVPGAISGYDALLKRFGTMSFKETFERAARASPRKAGAWPNGGTRDLRGVGRRACRRSPIRTPTFLDGGKAPALYSIIRNPALAKALRLIQTQGKDALLQGRHRRRHRRQGAGQRRRDDARPTSPSSSRSGSSRSPPTITATTSSSCRRPGRASRRSRC